LVPQKKKKEFGPPKKNRIMFPRPMRIGFQPLQLQPARLRANALVSTRVAPAPLIPPPRPAAAAGTPAQPQLLRRPVAHQHQQQQASASAGIVAGLVTKPRPAIGAPPQVGQTSRAPAASAAVVTASQSTLAVGTGRHILPAAVTGAATPPAKRCNCGGAR
jgi:hypothetical protein